MRVLQVTPGYPPTAGGVELHVARISAELTRRGHQVTVLTTDAGGPSIIRDDVSLVRVPARPVGPFSLPVGAARRLAALAAEHDVVQVHNYHSPLPLLALLTVRSTPVVVTPHFHGGGHSTVAALAHPPYRAAFRAVLPRAAAFTFVSAAERDRFRRDFDLRDRPSPVIHNGHRTPTNRTTAPAHSTPSTAAATPTAPGVGARERMVVTVNRLEPYKRVDTVISAVGGLPGAPACVVVGDGPDRERLERLAAGHPHVRFAGRVRDADLDALLARATVAVTASEHEAFGMAALDALAAGAAVVASDIPAHRELATLAPGLTLWDPGTGALGLRDLIRAALDGGPPPIAGGLPTWAAAAEALEHLYDDVVTRKAGTHA